MGFVRDQLRHVNIVTTDVYANVIKENFSSDPPEQVANFLQAINPLHSKNRDTL